MSDAGTRLRQKLREFAALPPGEPVPSPCINVCRIDGPTALCEGCLRTLDEVAAWSSMPQAQRREVWRQLPRRLEEAA